MSQGKPHLYDIDRAKGLAILLVVFGHIVMRDQPLGNEWYRVLRDAVYEFHMPFFMYLSGIVMFYSGSARTSRADYPAYIRKRAYRFLLPFLLMGLLIVFGKVAARSFIHVDNAAHGIGEGLVSLLWFTQASPAISLWYIFVIFVYCAVVPPLLWLTRGRMAPLVGIGVFLYLLPLPAYVYLHKAGHFFIFYILGGVTVLRFREYLAFIDRWRMVLLGVFAASFALIPLGAPGDVSMAVIGGLSMPALHALVRMKPLETSESLLFFGKYCFVIYLFNTIMIGLTKGVMLRFVSWDGVNFLFFAPILFCAGVAGPIVLKRFVFSRNKFLDTMTT